MGKNGGKPQDTILTLEEALKRFARKRIENTETKDAAIQAAAPVSKVVFIFTGIVAFKPSLKSPLPRAVTATWSGP